MEINVPNTKLILRDINKDAFTALKNECIEGLTHVKEHEGERLNDIIKMGSPTVERHKYSYSLTNSKKLVESEVLKTVNEFLDVNDCFESSLLYSYDFKSSDDIEFFLYRLWSNYQAPTEFIPAHSHSAFITFVIFVDIPFEHGLSINDANKDHSDTSAEGNFEFFYNDIVGNQQTFRVPADKNYEGKILMFPGTLVHSVYPFYNNDRYRITVSGNVRARKKIA